MFYIGGMYLNDAFDRDIDARERPERPIPSGHVGARRWGRILRFYLIGVKDNGSVLGVQFRDGIEVKMEDQVAAA